MAKHSQPVQGRAAFSLVEAIVGISITTIAGAALLSSIGSSVTMSSWNTRNAIARGLAEQLMEEIAAARFPADGSSQSNRPERFEFQTIDDFDGWTSSPPVTATGVPLGLEGRLTYGRWRQSRESYYGRPSSLQIDRTTMNRYRRDVVVERVQREPDGSWSVIKTDSPYRRVIVTVTYTDQEGESREMTRLERLFADASPQS